MLESCEDPVSGLNDAAKFLWIGGKRGAHVVKDPVVALLVLGLPRCWRIVEILLSKFIDDAAFQWNGNNDCEARCKALDRYCEACIVAISLVEFMRLW